MNKNLYKFMFMGNICKNVICDNNNRGEVLKYTGAKILCPTEDKNSLLSV